MRVLYQGDSNMILYPISYSPAALERAFDVTGMADVLGVPALIVLRKDKTAAAIIYAEPSLEENGELRHLVAAKLDLIPRKSIDQNESILVVKRYRESKAIVQVEGVVVDKPVQDTRVATTLYEHLVVDKELILMSDDDQYIGGQNIWNLAPNESRQSIVLVAEKAAN